MELNLITECIFRLAAVNKSQILWNDLIKDQTPQGCLYIAFYNASVCKCHALMNVNDLMQCDLFIFICQQCLVHTWVIMSKYVSCSTDDMTVTICHILKMDHIINVDDICINVCLDVLFVSIFLIRNSRNALFLGMICQTIHGQIVDTKYHIL